jgi:hypothetical protein
MELVKKKWQLLVVTFGVAAEGVLDLYVKHLAKLGVLIERYPKYIQSNRSNRASNRSNRETFRTSTKTIDKQHPSRQAVPRSLYTLGLSLALSQFQY